MTTKLDFATLQVRGGTTSDGATGAIQTPIYQTVGYEFTDEEQAAGILNAQDLGYAYSRFTNPTCYALANRVAELDGGTGGAAVASGRGAILLALYPLMSPGKNIVASSRLYRGTNVLFTETMKKFGWSAKIVDFDDLDALRAAIDENTRGIFCEGVSNPGNYMTDLEAVSAVAKAAGLPLMVDNSLATPALLRPFEFGANITVYSATKFLSGSGSVIAGVVVDGGNFDWSASDKFPSLAAPEPTCANHNFHQSFGNQAFARHAVVMGLRDFGLTLNPQGAHYVLLGTETLNLRMKQHTANAMALAEWLEQDPRVENVQYLGSEKNPYADRVRKYCPNGVGGLLTFDLKAGYQACIDLIKSLKLFTHSANIGDARSMIVHAGSVAMRMRGAPAPSGAGTNMLRVSVGTESVNDLIADLDRALGEVAR